MNSLKIIFFLTVVNYSASMESADDDDEMELHNGGLIDCVPTQKCKVLFGSKPSHFSIYGYASYHQLDCLPEEGNALCVVSADTEGLQTLPCLPREKCSLLWGSLKEHFSIFGHQPLCRKKSYFRCVTSKEDELIDSAKPPNYTTAESSSNSTEVNQTTNAPIITTEPQPASSPACNGAPAVVSSTAPAINAPIITTEPQPTSSHEVVPSSTTIGRSNSRDSTNIRSSLPSVNPEEIAQTAGFITFPEKVPDNNSPGTFFPFHSDDGKINVNAPYAHHWSVNPSTKIEINGRRPTYLNANEATLRSEAPAIPRKISLYDFLTKAETVDM